MKPIECLVETGIYADDLVAAEHFYSDVLGLTIRAREDGRHVFFQVGDRSMLLVFRPEATLRGDPLPAHGRGDRATSRWASHRRTSTHGGNGCASTGSRSSTRSPGRAAAIRSTFATRRVTPSS